MVPPFLRHTLDKKRDFWQNFQPLLGARMAKLVDAPASGAGAFTGVEVRVLFRAPTLLSLSSTFCRQFPPLILFDFRRSPVAF